MILIILNVIPIKIRSFILFANYLRPQTVHQHRSTELVAIFVAKLTSLSAAT